MFHSGYKNEKFLDKLVEITYALKKMYFGNNFSSEISIRNAKHFLQEYLENGHHTLSNFKSWFIDCLVVSDLDDPSGLEEFYKLGAAYIKELNDIYDEGNGTDPDPVGLNVMPVMMSSQLDEETNEVFDSLLSEEGVEVEEEE